MSPGTLLRAARLAMTLCLATPLAQAGQTVAFPAERSVIELQPQRRTERVALATTHPPGSISLVQLNPAINAYLVLEIFAPPRQQALQYHLENPDPANQRLALDPALPGQLNMTVAGSTTPCALWPDEALARARLAPSPYVPLCQGRVYLRNTLRGHRSALEASTDFLRDYVWGGEQIIGLVRRRFYQDRFLESALPAPTPAAQTPDLPPPDAPLPARLKVGTRPSPLVAAGLGLSTGTKGALLPGHWLATTRPHVFVSVAQPGTLAVDGSAGTGSARGPDPVEADALVYLVAFDLAAFELGFALGTEHPRLGWSSRVRTEQRNPAWAGPDGFGSAAPLARTGQVSPALQPRVVATFTGGFKREHGAFRYGALATAHHGSHYGFMEQGVVFSTLVPGLSTLYVQDDGEVGMKTWTDADVHRLGRLRHARQNGVPLVERGPDAGSSVIGPLVDQWGPGNWSGSADEKLRSLRSGACLIERPGRRFLVYAYFSAATPRTMAQVLHSYGCSYAMHLDMNALEHTYFALYSEHGKQHVVEHLVRGMASLDQRAGDTWVPRFLGFADERDFFYVMARAQGK